MWVFGKDCFVSVVEDWNDNSMVYVRARREKDLRNFLKYCDYPIDINHTPENDYHYRQHLPKKFYAEAIGRMAMNIDYTNYKDAVVDKSLHQFAGETWNSGYRNLAEGRKGFTFKK